ncbi:maleylpyruvate isomerase N-terminal domain-containing protein [Leucobacter komagatae]|uniref:maleylpyruvate isomerase N-terminal domain-containing protein n=1 Tax=Leucobacter komagatae TaxID=55969 RepID=UPI0012ED1312|nr:maleylpyruvate isomerase N-terminal domain-containing protein [Leucobacter komagatae]
MARIYLDGVSSLEYLVSAMRPGDEEARVPATPLWSVRQLFSHLAGASTDTLESRLDGSPGRGWTQRQVDERASYSVAQSMAEIRRNADTLAPMLDDVRGPNPAWDVRVHEYDLREALRIDAEQRHTWQDVAFGAIELYNLRDDALGELRISETGVVLEGTEESMLRVDMYELFRGMFSRRSQAQILAWDWSPRAPRELADDIPLFFGPRLDAQPTIR